MLDNYPLCFTCIYFHGIKTESRGSRTPRELVGCDLKGDFKTKDIPYTECIYYEENTEINIMIENAKERNIFKRGE